MSQYDEQETGAFIDGMNTGMELAALGLRAEADHSRSFATYDVLRGSERLASGLDEDGLSAFIAGFRAASGVQTA